jgi:hypothetical protein
MFMGGCSSKDVRQEVVATVNGDPIRVSELRESLGVPAGAFATVDIPVERKKEALDRLVAVRLLAGEGHSLGIDNTPQYKEIIRRNDEQNDRLLRIKALLLKEIRAKLKVTSEEIKAEIAKVKAAKEGISDADAAMRAVKSVSGSRVQKIQADLIAVAKKETAAAVDPKALARIGKEESVPDNVVLASVGDGKILYGDVKKILQGFARDDASSGQDDLSRNPEMVGNVLEREVTMRALVAYAKKQEGDSSEGYKAVRKEMERYVLLGMVADNVAGKSVQVTDKEIEEAYALRTAPIVRDGKKIDAAMAAELKRQIRMSLLKERGKEAFDAHVAELRKKGKITVNDAVLPKV